MNYQKIISQAYEISRKNIYLWWLSLLAVIGGASFFSQGSSSSFNFDFSLPQEFPTDKLETIEKMPFFNSIEKFFDNIIMFIPIIIIIALIILVLKIILYIIGLIAQSGLVKSIDLLYHKKKSSFKEGFSQGQKYALKLFLTRLFGWLLRLAFGIVSIITVLILFLFFFITIPVLIIAGIILELVIQNAQILVITKNMGIIESYKKSWQLIIKNFKEIAILALVQFLIGIGVLLAVIIVTLIIAAIGVILGLLLNSLNLGWLMITILVSPFVLLLVLIFIAIAALTNTYFTSFWTLAVNNLTPKSTSEAKSAAV